MKGYLDVKELETYRKADIQELARTLGVSDAGTIKEIAARCAAVEIEVDEEELTDEERAALWEEKEAIGQRTGDGGQDTEEAPHTGKETMENDKAEETAGDAEKAREEAAGVKVEVMARYLDKRLNQIKEAGEVFTVDEERAAVLVHEKVAKIRE